MFLPDWVRFVSRVEEALARRDFTVNALLELAVDEQLPNEKEALLS